jgi:hypothetical protein
MRFLKILPTLFIAPLLVVPPSFAFDFPLSDTSSRAAYFLGQRHDNSVGEFLARYSRHLPAPKTGPYVSDVTLFTPFAQMVYYSSRQGMYTAQQAERDGQAKFSSIEVSVYISLTETYGAYFSEPPPSASSGAGTRLRPGSFWRDFTVRVLDGEVLLQPDTVYGQPQYRCSGGGCALTGALIHLGLPAEAFASDSVTVEVATPDGQLVSADFNLVSLR